MNCLKPVLLAAVFAFGTSASATPPLPIFPGGPASIVSIAAADEHNCILSEDSAYCWGENQYGQAPDS